MIFKEISLLCYQLTCLIDRINIFSTFCGVYRTASHVFSIKKTAYDANLYCIFTILILNELIFIFVVTTGTPTMLSTLLAVYWRCCSCATRWRNCKLLCTPSTWTLHELASAKFKLWTSVAEAMNRENLSM